jgi:hypothetical protein
MELLKTYNDESRNKRVEWYNENAKDVPFIGNDKLYSAYRLLLCRFGIGQEEAPVIEKNDREVVFHSKNFCPTLEACKILGLDTRYICKHYNEESTDSLIKQVDKSLAFQRNYEKIRPYSEYCEERIVRVN